MSYVSPSNHRILHVGKYSPTEPGGMEAFLGDLLRASSRRGLNVSALVHGKNRSDSRYDATSNEISIDVVGVACTVLFAPIAPNFLTRLNALIQDFKPTIIHFHLPNLSAFSALLSVQARSIPWVVTWHADVDFQPRSLVVRALLRIYSAIQSQFLSRVRFIMPTSEPYLMASAPLSAWRTKCVVVPLGVDPARLSLELPRDANRSAVTWPSGSGLKLLVIARRSYYKDIETVLKALAELNSGRLLIVGELSPRARDLVEHLGLRGRVESVGRLHQPALNHLLKSADILCLPAKDRSEAFGLVLLEAAWFGVKVIASDIPGSGVSWVAKDLCGGVVVPPGDHLALAKQLTQIDSASRDGDQKTEIADIQRKLLIEVDVCLDKIIKVYDSANCASSPTLSL